MKKYYVYELYNLLGTIEYVGESTRPIQRFANHIKHKPIERTGIGKFYQRSDLSLNIAYEFDTKRQAWKYQCKLQKEYGLITDSERLQRKDSLETKKKKSLAKIGIKRTDKVKQKISNSMRIYHKFK